MGTSWSCVELAELLRPQEFPVGGARRSLGQSVRSFGCTSPEMCVPSGAADTPLSLPFVLCGCCSGGVYSGPGTGWASGFISLSPPTHLQRGELGPSEAEHLVWDAQPCNSNAGTRTGVCCPLVPRFCRLFGEPVGTCMCRL